LFGITNPNAKMSKNNNDAGLKLFENIANSI